VTSAALTVAGYAALLACLAAVALAARLRPALVPRASDVVRHAARTRAGQLVLVLVWWWLGWHFLLAA
jgi:hypothetical protein